jgi:MFS family permease
MTFARRILVSSSLFHGLNDAATVAVPMVFPILYGRQFIIHSYSQIGLLSNFGLLSTLLFQVLVVHFSQKVEYRHLLGVSFAGISLTMFLIPLSSAYAVFFLLYLLFRIFDSFYHTVGMACGLRGPIRTRPSTRRWGFRAVPGCLGYSWRF